MMISKLFRYCVATGLFCAAANASINFNFDADTLGTATNFTDTIGGLSATFSSAADPGGFAVYQTMFETLTGNVLGDPGPAGQDNLVLNVGFSGELSALTFNFATSDFTTPSPLTLSAFENSTLVGSAVATGNFLSGFSFPEGEIAFKGANFNQIAISSTSTDFAVDNINVTTATTPEPNAFVFLAAGIFALTIPALWRRFVVRSLSR